MSPEPDENRRAIVARLTWKLKSDDVVANMKFKISRKKNWKCSSEKAPIKCIYTKNQKYSVGLTLKGTKYYEFWTYYKLYLSVLSMRWNPCFLTSYNWQSSVFRLQNIHLRSDEYGLFLKGNTEFLISVTNVVAIFVILKISLESSLKVCKVSFEFFWVLLNILSFLIWDFRGNWLIKIN